MTFDEEVDRREFEIRAQRKASYEMQKDNLNRLADNVNQCWDTDSAVLDEDGEDCEKRAAAFQYRHPYILRLISLSGGQEFGTIAFDNGTWSFKPMDYDDTGYFSAFQCSDEEEFARKLRLAAVEGIARVNADLRRFGT